MTKVQVELMKKSGRLLLSKWQLFWHYSIIPFLLIFPIIRIIDIIKDQLPLNTLSIEYAWIIAAAVFYIIQKKRLRFREIKKAVDISSFMEAVEKTVKELEWDILSTKNDTIVAKSGFSWRSWGEQITIIWEKDRILFNSICDPDNKPSVASFGMNKVNRKVFESFLP